MFETFISAADLHAHLDAPGWVIVDCRFDLNATALGRILYERSHIPGAVYAHLDDDLSGPPVTDHGRHPLPTADALRALFSRLGIGAQTQVVAYDNFNGAFAARLWWMLRYMGHRAVALLDGGWSAWTNGGFPTASGAQHNPPAHFDGTPNHALLVTLDAVTARPLLIDSRDAQRYSGAFEPIDPRPGHIPGAVNHHFATNWDERGLLLPSDVLRDRFTTLLGATSADEATFYCGSGVTACFNLVAMQHAGLPLGKLYVGSWSEWARAAERPAATGPLPGGADAV